ncbi:hypothetical protein [Hymenobacter sp. IS2118]|uniref:hypothetical protein n=1 Tax=Hymenobacter sp. IS2118 TaxID=1505605 RepID=UPI0012684F56|nr:hypothetical protein [Hymenobacter sp. IS2118]
MLLSACGSNQTTETAKPPEAPAPHSYVQALLRTGLVAEQHRRWLLFADTTRQDMYQLGHTPREVRWWLASYEERIEKKLTLDPDSLQLFIATAEQMRHPPPPPPMVTIIRFPSTPAAKVRAHKQTIHLTQQLQQAGLLTAAEYRRTLPLATAGEFYSRRNLLMTVNEMALVAEGLQQSGDLPPTLQRLGLLTKAQAQQLAHDLRAGVFTDPVEVLPRLPYARLFNRRQYPAAMLPYLEQLHRDVAKLLSGLQFTNFRAWVITPGEMSTCINCDGAEDVLVQLKIGTKEYAQRSEWQPKYSLNGGSQPEIDANQFYHLFNQALADQGSPHRLVFVESEQAKHIIGGQFGLWRMTAPQAEALDTLGASALQLEAYESFKILPTDTVTAALRAFEALGFLRHLSPAQRAAAEAHLHQARLQSREEVLHYVPGSVGEYQGDPQYRSWSYARLLQVLRQISSGRFSPSLVRDGCQHADGTLRFQLGNRVYSTPLYQANESPDPRLFQLVQRALREQHIPGKFYRVSFELAQSKGMVVNYVFLSPPQERAIRQRHLLDLTDPTLSDEERYALEEARDSASQSGQ